MRHGRPTRLRARAVALLLGPALLAAPAAASAQAPAPVVRFTTSLGTIDVRLLPEAAPKTVQNFLGYVGRGDYDGSFFHRSVKGFVIQGGGYAGDVTAPTQLQGPKVVNEYRESNVRGTLAMARTPGQQDSATSQWFFNQADNTQLDSVDGGFTVFGRVTDAAGLAVVDAINALPIRTSGALNELPVRNWTSGPVLAANGVMVTSVAVLPATPLFPLTPPPPPPAPAVPGPGGIPTTPPVKRAPAFRLLSRAVAAPTLRRGATRLRISVAGLPPRTALKATLRGAGTPVTVRGTAPAKGGTGRVTFPISRAMRTRLRGLQTSVLQVSVTATPPGGRASSARTLLVVAR